MINEKDIKKFIDQEVKKRKILELMNLTHWDLSFEVGDTIGEYSAGECVSDSAYFMAQITLNPKYMLDTHTMKETFIHELCHLLISPLEGYAHTMVVAFRGGEEEVTWESKHHEGVQRIAVEQTVTSLTRVFMKLIYPDSVPEVMGKPKIFNKIDKEE